MAVEVDRLSGMFAERQAASDVEGMRAILLEAVHWCRQFSSEPCDAEELGQLAGDLAEAPEEELDRLGNKAAEAVILLIVASWDVAFCSAYFPGMEAYPLFELMMPRLAPSVEIEPGTGKFMRGGLQPRQGIFEKSMFRLLDCIAVLCFYRRHRRFPDAVPSVRDMAAWFVVDEGKIVSWRDETTRFTERDLVAIWGEALSGTPSGERPQPPIPLLAAAHLWSPLLVREKGKPVSWIFGFEAYEGAWRAMHSYLLAKGLTFGTTPWPTCLTFQSSGSSSPDSWRSSQSSGRSSQPRDSQ